MHLSRRNYLTSMHQNWYKCQLINIMKKVLKQQYYVWPNILPTKHLLFKLQFSKFVKRYFHGTIVKIIYRMIDLNFMVVNFPCRKLNNSSSTATYSHVVSFFYILFRIGKTAPFLSSTSYDRKPRFSKLPLLCVAEQCYNNVYLCKRY